MDIYVGNLPYSIDEQTLNQTFSEHGAVEKVNIITDKYTGKAKGFAFVTMPDQREGNDAIQALDGAEIDGRNIKVNQARQREDRPPRRNHGGGGGGGYNRR